MSVALQRRGGGGGGGGFLRGPCRYGTPAPVPGSASCSSSSVGRNSDSDGDGDGSESGDEAEVQSSFKGPLDTMDALEDSLPFSRRGISKFYCGKSKSFTMLSDAISKSASAKDLAKPENAYSRKRKNFLSLNFMSKKFHNNQDRIAKKPSSDLSMTNLVDTSSSGSNSTSSEEDRDQGQKGLLPPLHPHSRPGGVMICDDSDEAMSAPMRSFSMADLQGIVGPSPLISRRDGQKRRFY